ncbi:MAG: hypothetical protein ACJATI_005010, partial [Halioglobus sp.]
HKYLLGIKFLLIGYWDGKSFAPLDFSLHREPGKSGKGGLKKKVLDSQFSKVRPTEGCANERV